MLRNSGRPSRDVFSTTCNPPSKWTKCNLGSAFKGLHLYQCLCLSVRLMIKFTFVINMLIITAQFNRRISRRLYYLLRYPLVRIIHNLFFMLLHYVIYLSLSTTHAFTTNKYYLRNCGRDMALVETKEQRLLILFLLFYHQNLLVIN